MERVYVEINESGAKTANDMMSFQDYVPGSRTREYKEDVDEVYNLAEEVKEKRGEDAGAKAWKLALRYAKNLGEYINKDIRIGCMCPSVLISGAGNFPVRKKEKQNAAADRNHEYYNYVQSIRGKIQNLLYAKEVIRSDDENAIEALEDKVQALTALQEKMKAVNKYFRKHKTLDGCDLLDESQIENLRASMECYTWERQPYPSFELQNNLANIKRCQERLDGLRRIKDKGTSEQDYGFCKVVENAEEMRIQILFDGKPDEAIRKILKGHGFRWAPSQGAWQRQLNNNGKYAAKTVIEKIKAEGLGA